MPRRHDSLPARNDLVGLRIDVEPGVRDKLRIIAAEHKYSMASLLRLLINAAVAKPKKYFQEIPKNPGKTP